MVGALIRCCVTAWKWCGDSPPSFTGCVPSGAMQPSFCSSLKPKERLAVCACTTWLAPKAVTTLRSTARKHSCVLGTRGECPHLLLCCSREGLPSRQAIVPWCRGHHPRASDLATLLTPTLLSFHPLPTPFHHPTTIWLGPLRTRL